MADVTFGIDVDSTDVDKADRSFDRFKSNLKDAEKRFGGVARSSADADRRVRGFGNAAQQAEQRARAAAAQMAKMQANMDRLNRLVGQAAGLFKGFLGFELIRRLAATADAYTEITNKLRVVSDEQTNVNALFGELLDVANRTRTPVEGIATLYQRASMAAKELGADQQQLIQFTENVGRALALQGGSAAAASGALLQLSQALGSGVVRAEEFNSILEGAFPIAQAAARGIEAAGGSVAKLRALIADGKVTSDQFFTAILSQTAELEAAFAKTSPTMGQAFTVLRDNVMATVGGMNEMLGATSALASGIIFLGQNIERLIVYAGTAAAIFGARFAVGLAASVAATLNLSTALGVLRGALIRTGIGALVVAAGEMVFQFTRLVEATGGWGNALNALWDIATAVWNGITTGASGIPVALSGVWGQLSADFYGTLSDMAGAWGDFTNMLAGWASAAGLDGVAGKLIELRDNADKFSTEMGEAWDQAHAMAEAAAAAAGNLAGASGAAGSLGAGLGKAAGAAKKVADELARAKDVLAEQVKAHQDLVDRMAKAGDYSEFVTKETDRLRDALEKSGMSLDDFLRTMDMTRDTYRDMLRDTERMTNELERQAQLAEDIGAGLRQMATGDFSGGLENMVQSLADSLWGTQMDDAFKKAGEAISKAVSKGLGGIGAATGLSDTAMSYVGAGIGTAAVGVLNGSAQQVGAGIGSAIGGALGTTVGTKIGGMLGSIAGPIGTVLGAAAGGFISKLFGGGDDDKWKQVTGTAFTGTTYETAVTSRGRINTQTDQGFSPEGRFAFDGLVKLTANFNRELREYVKAAGGEVEKGTNLVVNQNAVIKAIAGRTENLPYKGEEGKRFAEQISTRVAEVMALAGTIAKKAGPELTNAQKLWRETQERFSKENVAILRDLGFSARQIRDAQANIRRDLAGDFNKEMLDALVDTGRATKRELDDWKNAELRALNERREAAFHTAREIGASTAVVYSSFRAQRNEILANYKDMLSDIGKATIEAIQSTISTLTTKLNGLDQERSEVMAELTKRAEEARNAERALADARKALAVSDLAPGGPMDQLRALQSQFNAAIGAAKGGDAGAASTAASLAQSLLQQGQQVYASGGAYSALFKSVNTSLAQAQSGLGAGAQRIEKQLDPLTFMQVTEKSTTALLKALSTLNTSIQKVEAQIAAQNKKLAAAEQKARVA